MSKDEREWRLVRKESLEMVDMTLSGVVGPPISPDDVLVPKTALEAAEAEWNTEHDIAHKLGVAIERRGKQLKQAEAEVDRLRVALKGIKVAARSDEALSEPLDKEKR